MDIALKEIELFRTQLKNLPKDSVVIQDVQTPLLKAMKANFWENLDAKSFDFLREIITPPLFRTVSQVDFKAMRFKKDVLETSLAHLEENEEQLAILKENIQEKVSLLPCR